MPAPATLLRPNVGAARHNRALVDRACAYAGSRRKLAKLLGVSPNLVVWWWKRGQVTEGHRSALERVTGGAVKAADFQIIEVNNTPAPPAARGARTAAKKRGARTDDKQASKTAPAVR